MTPQDNYIKTALRLPPGLHDQLKSAAEYNGRSLNAEILARLLASTGPVTLDTLAEQQRHTQQMVQQIIDAMERR